MALYKVDKIFDSYPDLQDKNNQGMKLDMFCLSQDDNKLCNYQHIYMMKHIEVPYKVNTNLN